MNGLDYWRAMKAEVEKAGASFRGLAKGMDQVQESVAWAMRSTSEITPETLLGTDLTPHDAKEANTYQVRFGACQTEFCDAYYLPTNSLCTRNKNHTGIHAAENHRDELVASWYG